MGSREENKSQRKDDILRAARSLMRQPGGSAFSMRSLAEQAGVSIATPYNLFGSKQAILVALLDEDFSEYQIGLAGLEHEGLEALFEAVAVMQDQFAREPDFYRNVFAAVASEGGPELRFLLSGPRYVLWKQLIRAATLSGLLNADIDPDAFTITLSQLILANVQEWSRGFLELEEMDARIRYGLALLLSAIATETGKPELNAKLHAAERDLQNRWRAILKERMREGKLSEAARTVLADQLAHIGSTILEQPEEETTI